jgi:hypothetical protein
MRDTVGELARRGKIKGGGSNVFEKSITVADARRNGADREDVVERERSVSIDRGSTI